MCTAIWAQQITMVILVSTLHARMTTHIYNAQTDIRGFSHRLFNLVRTKVASVQGANQPNEMVLVQIYMQRKSTFLGGSDFQNNYRKLTPLGVQARHCIMDTKV